VSRNLGRYPVTLAGPERNFTRRRQLQATVNEYANPVRCFPASLKQLRIFARCLLFGAGLCWQTIDRNQLHCRLALRAGILSLSPVIQHRLGKVAIDTKERLPGIPLNS